MDEYGKVIFSRYRDYESDPSVRLIISSESGEHYVLGVRIALVYLRRVCRPIEEQEDAV